MATVELVIDADCPNVEEARANLLRAFTAAGVKPQWTEYLRSDAPPHARGYGSPTILVDGRDVAGALPDADACCRVFESADGSLVRAPEVATIARAIASGAEQPSSERRSLRGSLGVIPAVLAALLPNVTCPACWPAYAGVLGSLGLTFLMDAAWLLPLTSVFLAVALGVLAFRARARRGYGPFVLGLAASAVLLAGKFVVESELATYAGVGLLVSASVWNSWPRNGGAHRRSLAMARDEQKGWRDER